VFGFERMMDTLGAIIGPLTAVWLLRRSEGNYRPVFLWSLLPGIAAVACFGLLVRERGTTPSAGSSFLKGLRDLPRPFIRFLLAVGIFGLGDFAHALLILYATQVLTPREGPAAAANVAIGLYLLHNIFYAGFAYLAGWLGDRTPRRLVLASGYGLAAIAAALLSLQPQSLLLLVVVFILGGIYVGVEEALEDSLAAELAPRNQHGMAFGTLAAVNALGDLVSSVLVGFLWSAASASVAFGLAGILFVAGAVLVFRLR
jgi:MFS family permease